MDIAGGEGHGAMQRVKSAIEKFILQHSILCKMLKCTKICWFFLHLTTQIILCARHLKIIYIGWDFLEITCKVWWQNSDFLWRTILHQVQDVLMMRWNLFSISWSFVFSFQGPNQMVWKRFRKGLSFRQNAKGRLLEKSPAWGIVPSSLTPSHGLIYLRDRED